MLCADCEQVWGARTCSCPHSQQALCIWLPGGKTNEDGFANEFIIQAVVSGCQQIHIGDADVVLTGGTDSMSLAPHVVRGMRTSAKLGGELLVEDYLLWENWFCLTGYLAISKRGQSLKFCYSLIF